MTINGKTTPTRLLVSGLGKQKIILGFPWLNEHNPDIDWKTGRFTWRNNQKPRRAFKIKRCHEKGNPNCKHPLCLVKWVARQVLKTKTRNPKPTITEELDQDEKLNRTQNPTPNDEILIGYLEEVQRPNDIWINAKTSNAIEFHLKHDEKKDDLPLNQQIPETYHDYLDVFDEDKANRFPGSRPWDHKIELKEGFQPKSFKTYNLTPEEQKELG